MTAPAAEPAASWQSVLVAEQAAVFGYGALGPRLPAGPQVQLARSCQQGHRVRVDAALGALSGLGALPAATASGPSPGAVLQLPGPLSDDQSAGQLAVHLEEATASAWRYLLSTLAGEPASVTATAGRATALAALTDSAVQAVRWRRIASPAQASVAFPGI